MIEKKRILPVYLVIDCSSSMFGEPVEAYGDIEQFFPWSDMKIKQIAMGL